MEHLFECQDEAFHNGDAAVLADRTEARFDAVASTPGLETVTPELAALVADKMLRRLASDSNCPAEK